MRLIDVNTLELKGFFGVKTPAYAILSHAWGKEEVTFQEWERRSDATIQRKEGYVKIMGACQRARQDGLKYLWCDTNCIDKSSSAELSEAINTMFTWYYNSNICYVHLSDVYTKDMIPQSRWLTRGWTLQELLAPNSVLFFNRNWDLIGNRFDLAGSISDVTKIHIGALMDRSTIQKYSIAQRMSWAADRQTSRLEDIAYCLLGIFDINMPLLYGEGSKAFARLQQEIIKVSDDQSILAWDLLQLSTSSLTSALAPSPAEFRFSGSIVTNHETQRSSYSITNLGISVKLALIKTSIEGIVLVGLNCAKELYREAPHPKLPDGIRLYRHFRIWIPLYSFGYQAYARVHFPASKIFLAKPYPTLMHPTPTSLFLSLNLSEPHAAQHFKIPVGTLQQRSLVSSSRLLVSVAAGKTTSHERALQVAYPISNLSVVQLQRPKPSTVSHQLVSCNDFSIFFSVFWNPNGSPQDWLHTTMFDPELKLSSQMASTPKWSCLFGTCDHTHTKQCCSNAATMRSLHNELRKISGGSLDNFVKQGRDPIVIVEDLLLKNAFGESELIVDIIFRNVLKF